MCLLEFCGGLERRVDVENEYQLLVSFQDMVAAVKW